MSILLILLIIIGVIGIYIWQTYNFFVTTKTRIGASIQEIGNQLKRQANLIPNLIESTKGYLEHEKGIYEKITQAREKVAQAAGSQNAQEMVDAAQSLGQALGGIQVVVESNPELKASETVQKLMEELRDTADKIMYARRTLIDLTADYNTRLATFPSNLVGKMFKFSPERGLKTENVEEITSVNFEETKNPEVKL